LITLLITLLIFSILSYSLPEYSWFICMSLDVKRQSIIWLIFYQLVYITPRQSSYYNLAYQSLSFSLNITYTSINIDMSSLLFMPLLTLPNFHFNKRFLFTIVNYATLYTPIGIRKSHQ
jgi:hypothetical protein